MARLTAYKFLQSLNVDFERGTLPRDQCVEWPFMREPTGYGILRRKGKAVRAHRLSLALKLGLQESYELPDDGFALHSPECTSRACVNPHHLRLGTAKENSMDVLRRDGAHPRSVLEQDDVAAIKACLAAGEAQVSLAEEYGVSPSTISLIAHGKTWAYVGDGDGNDGGEI